MDALCSAFASGFYNDVVADLGCGEGSLSLMLSRFVKQITCIDQSQKMLNLVYERAKEIKTEEKFTLIKGDLEIIDLEENKYDSIFLSQSLHHVSDPQKVVHKASKSLKDNGKMIILDLLKHDHEWTREQWADQWLGFMPEELTQWLNNQNMDILHNEVLRGFVPDLSVIMVIGKKGNNVKSSKKYKKKKDYCVADLSLADFGRKEMQIAEYEMPGLMALRKIWGRKTVKRRSDYRFITYDHTNRDANRNITTTWSKS